MKCLWKSRRTRLKNTMANRCWIKLENGNSHRPMVALDLFNRGAVENITLET